MPTPHTKIILRDRGGGGGMKTEKCQEIYQILILKIVFNVFHLYLPS
jgi:hypothetical protein